MRPVGIVRFAPTEGPAWFASWLTAAAIPWKEIRLDQGEPLPADTSTLSGLGLMGGPMSVNDPLPWVPPLLALIRDADQRGAPVIGHCLGGQLISRAFGGHVGINMVDGAPAKEIGWHTVTPVDTEQARDWFGTRLDFDVFQWHGETFSTPPGAIHLAASARCANQAFAIGPHLGMQFHCEMDEATIATWCQSGADEVAEALAGPHPEGVQDAATVMHATPERLPCMRAISRRIYERWAAGLRRERQ